MGPAGYLRLRNKVSAAMGLRISYLAKLYVEVCWAETDRVTTTMARLSFTLRSDRLRKLRATSEQHRSLPNLNARANDEATGPIDLAGQVKLNDKLVTCEQRWSK
jgi:hypothetical protein